MPPFGLHFLSNENWSCINNFTRSIGATTVLAKAPDNAPATASLAGVGRFVATVGESDDAAGATEGSCLREDLSESCGEDDCKAGGGVAWSMDDLPLVLVA